MYNILWTFFTMYVAGIFANVINLYTAPACMAYDQVDVQSAGVIADDCIGAP